MIPFHALLYFRFGDIRVRRADDGGVEQDGILNHVELDFFKSFVVVEICEYES